MWKRWIALALAVAFISSLVWMLAVGQYETFAFGLGVLAGSFAAHWLTGLNLGTTGFWTVALSMLALVAVTISLPSGSVEGLWVLSTSFISGAGIFGSLSSPINRYGPFRKGGRQSARVQR